MSCAQMYLRRTGLACAVLWSSACETSSGAVRVPAPDVAAFETQAYPVLLRDCGFPECHGSRGRFFRVFGPGRTRLDGDAGTFAPATADELSQSYDRARSMLAHESSVLDSWLLRKPLGVEAGGADHGGADKWGRNVYESVEAPGYAVIRSWAVSQQKKSSPSGP